MVIDRDSKSPIQCPRKVLEQIMDVRDSGFTNMMDRGSVQMIADSMEFCELVCWIEDNPKEYSRGIMRGFKVVDDE